jgi:hypothetical protein
MKTIVIESPYQSDNALTIQINVTYAENCLKDALDRGESPYASHLLLTRVLDDNNPIEREKGLKAGQAFLSIVDLVVFYIDFGYSPGMIEVKKIVDKMRLKYEERKLNVQSM